MTARRRVRGGWSGQQVLAFWAIGALVVVALLVLDLAAQPLLLAFAAILFGTSLRGLAEQLARRARCSVSLSLVICLIVAAALGVAIALWIAPRVAEQFAALASSVLHEYERLQTRWADSAVVQRLLGGSLELQHPMGYVGRAAGIFASVVGTIGAAVFVGFVAVYIAASPEVYRRGLVRLAPPRHRARLADLLDEQARTLRRWMLGRLVSMTAVGISTSAGLWLLGIPLPVALGILAGGLGFIPNIGPIVSAVPALLIAAAVDIPHAVYVLALYLGINVFDGYVLTPSIARRSVALPPGLVIIAQLVFGALWGLLGLTLAVPLLACGAVLVQRLYVEAVLESGGEA